MGVVFKAEDLNLRRTVALGEGPWLEFAASRKVVHPLGLSVLDC